MDDPLPAKGARLDELVEIVHQVRKALLARDESPAGDWVERTAEGLRSGGTVGWYYPIDRGAGLSFYSSSGTDAYGHVHVADEPGAVDRGERLANVLLDRLPPEIRSINVGFTGLSPAPEQELYDRLAPRSGSTVIERMAMERSLGTEDGRPPGPVPEGLTLVPIRAVTIDALADLDFRSVTGTVDALLIGERREEYRRVTAALLAGSLGRFLDEASIALLLPDPPRLVGAILSAERSPRKAIVVNFMVDPEFRRRGYGKYLFRWELRALWALGYQRVHLWVTAANEPARRLYKEFHLEPTVRSTIYRVTRASGVPQPHSER
ncbi:MAG TPA: GNAT family N-acetyltransferase [Thermoplasmata archaeon]|nr:GNAT family N-acetyltransferase [Thermoplasmata archaeon]